MRRQCAQQVVMRMAGRPGEPEDVAEMVHVLAPDAADLNGATIDGGGSDMP